MNHENLRPSRVILFIQPLPADLLLWSRAMPSVKRPFGRRVWQAAGAI